MGRKPKKKKQLTFHDMRFIYAKMQRVVAYYDDGDKYKTPEALTAGHIVNYINKGYHEIGMNLYRTLSRKYNFWARF